jgi:hypothetical protein
LANINVADIRTPMKGRNITPQGARAWRGIVGKYGQKFLSNNLDAVLKALTAYDEDGAHARFERIRMGLLRFAKGELGGGTITRQRVATAGKRRAARKGGAAKQKTGRRGRRGKALEVAAGNSTTAGEGAAVQ